MIDSVEIPTAILGFSTMPNFYAIYHSSRNISTSGLGGHIVISGSRSLSQAFGSTFSELFMVENIRTAVGISSSRDVNISGLGCHIAISGCGSLSQSFGATFFDVAVVGELDFVT